MGTLKRRHRRRTTPVRRRRELGGAKRIAVAVGALAIVVAFVAATVAPTLQGDGDGGEPSSGSLSSAGRELLALLAADRQATFHARYAATSTEQPDAEITIETWRKPPQVRQDSEIVAGGQRLRTRSLQLADRSMRCNQVADGPWTCQAAPKEAVGDALVDTIREEVRNAEVTARDARIEGRKVRCFRLRRTGNESELCATPDGIPVRVTGPGATLRLLEVTREVDGEVFLPPAEAAPA